MRPFEYFILNTTLGLYQGVTGYGGGFPGDGKCTCTLRLVRPFVLGSLRLRPNGSELGVNHLSLLGSAEPRASN